MAKRFSMQVDETVLAEFLQLARINEIAPGGMLRILLNSFQGRPNHATKEYYRWLQTLCIIGRTEGPEAAERWLASNPAPDVVNVGVTH